MHDEHPTYISTMTWAELLHELNVDEALRVRLGVKQCPFSGMVEEYMLADRFGGELDIWPAKWRGVIEAGRELNLAKQSAIANVSGNPGQDDKSAPTANFPN